MNIANLILRLSENVLKLSDELERMKRNDAIVMVPGQKQSRRILDIRIIRNFDVVQWRVPDRISRHYGLLSTTTISIVTGEGDTEGEWTPYSGWDRLRNLHKTVEKFFKFFVEG